MLENLKVSRIVRIVFSCLWIRKRGIRMTTTIKFQFYFVIGFTCYAYRNVVIWYSQKGKKLFEEAPIIYFQLKELRFFQSTFTFSISNKANSKFSVMDLWISLYRKISNLNILYGSIRPSIVAEFVATDRMSKVLYWIKNLCVLD